MTTKNKIKDCIRNMLFGMLGAILVLFIALPNFTVAEDNAKAEYSSVELIVEINMLKAEIAELKANDENHLMKLAQVNKNFKDISNQQYAKFDMLFNQNKLNFNRIAILFENTPLGKEDLDKLINLGEKAEKNIQNYMDFLNRDITIAEYNKNSKNIDISAPKMNFNVDKKIKISGREAKIIDLKLEIEELKKKTVVHDERLEILRSYDDTVVRTFDTTTRIMQKEIVVLLTYLRTLNEYIQVNSSDKEKIGILSGFIEEMDSAFKKTDLDNSKKNN